MIGECRSELVTNADAAAQPTGARPAPYGVFGGVPPRLLGLRATAEAVARFRTPGPGISAPAPTRS